MVVQACKLEDAMVPFHVVIKLRMKHAGFLEINKSNPITVLQDFEAVRFFRQSAHEGGKVVSPTDRPPLPPGNIPGTHSCRGDRGGAVG